MKRATLITVHGMGTTPENYNNEITLDLKHRLGEKFNALHIGKVYYQELLQANQKRVWDLVGRKVRWDALRQFMLYGFSDAAGLESSRESLHGVYSGGQMRVARELYLARQAMGGDGPVIVLAQSLGGQVVSCYFWDAQRAAESKIVRVGIWQDIKAFEVPIAGANNLTADDVRFLQGSTLHSLFTTGCQIPVFVAAHATQDILPIKPNANFDWQNFYDKDDVLGWPLAELSPQYADVVTDVPVNAGGGILGWITQSWNPFSHTQYWRDDEILDPLEARLKELL